MSQFKVITNIHQREETVPDVQVTLPIPAHLPDPLSKGGREIFEQLIKDNWHLVNYTVSINDRAKATKLAARLGEAFARSSDDPEIPAILEELKAIQAKPANERTASECWTRHAYLLTEYGGGSVVHDAIMERLDRYKGNVLEAMCGHTSYFDELEGRTVVATDGCEASLERYPFPERRRILCDLDVYPLSAFHDEEFDVISICFGYKYPKYLRAIASEFRRILKPNGILSFVENPKNGYEKYYNRSLERRWMNRLLHTAGFPKVRYSKIPVKDWPTKEKGEFIHIQAYKQIRRRRKVVKA